MLYIETFILNVAVITLRYHPLSLPWKSLC